MSAPSLLDRLQHFTDVSPNKVALSFLDEGGNVIKNSALTYADISKRSSALSEHLVSGDKALKMGDR